MTDMSEALRAALKEEKDKSRLAAYAIGTGILGDIESQEILLKKLGEVTDDEARGYIAIALGLMGTRSAVEPIQSIITESKYRPNLLKQAAIGLGLLGDKDLVPNLIQMLADAKGLATQAAISSALGFIGDARSIDPLVGMLLNKDLTERARGFAAVALGIVADKETLPWNTKIAIDLNYRASTQTLVDAQGGTGILDIL
jgi:HEAT repeat protein